MDPSLAELIADAQPSTVDGQWQRHVSLRFVSEGLSGRRHSGRWGTKNGFPALYLGKPLDSVVVEAYRHLVDPVIDDDPSILDHLAPRALITCTVTVSEILDLRRTGTRVQLGLTMTELTSSTKDEVAYASCQQVAEVAHQLGRHGLIAPAATGLGDTLVLFTDNLNVSERPQRVAEDDIWTTLPADPRRKPRLRVVKE